MRYYLLVPHYGEWVMADFCGAGFGSAAAALRYAAVKHILVFRIAQFQR